MTKQALGTTNYQGHLKHIHFESKGLDHRWLTAADGKGVLIYFTPRYIPQVL